MDFLPFSLPSPSSLLNLPIIVIHGNVTSQVFFFAVGLDKVSSRLLKDAADIVAPSLTSLFNISINTGCFPSTWKLAKISPLFKKGSKQDPSNYRPISVLPTISKLLEKAVHMQLYSYLCDNNCFLKNSLVLD